MPGTNLTRVEAHQRRSSLRVESYEIELDLSPDGPTFPSVTVIRFSADRAGASTFVDLIATRVRSIELNGVSLDPAAAYRDGRVELDHLATDNVLRVVADCAYMNTGEGLHRTVDPVDANTYLYTHFEVPEARRVFATFEQPDLKASFRFTITAPDSWLVASNSPAPEPAPAGEGRLVWRFPPTPRISTYITAVVAGPFHVVRDTYVAPDGQVIPLAVGCRASMAEHLDAAEILEITRAGFDYYLSLFDQPYPFAKYDQFFLPEYNIGAMENAGCVTLNESYLFRSQVTDGHRQRRAETVLHELAHMWFGDLVTMRWWDDLWLKESFATYMSILCLTEATRWGPAAWATFANRHKGWALKQDQMPSTHPIVADIRDLADVGINFDGITYAKGAAVLKQLVAWVGRDEFFAGMRTYFARHAWSDTTLDDLLEALADASGRDLTQWSNQWLRTAGPSTLTAVCDVDAEGLITSFHIEQQPPAEDPTLRPHRLAIGLYERRPTGLVRTERLELDLTDAHTPVPQLTGKARPDLILVNDDDLTYARIRLDDHSLDTLRSHIGELTDPVARALCWTSAWDMVRSAELAPRDYLRLIFAGIDQESEISVVQMLHQDLVTAVETYVDPAARAESIAWATAQAKHRLATAAPGGDLQLAWAMFLARVAPASETAFVADLRSGAQVISGLRVDTDLRWALLAMLARHGVADAQMIDAELADDRTTSGAEHAAGLLAARPDLDAKVEAWARVIDNDDLPNRVQEAIVGGRYARVGLGFVQSGQEAVLRDFADRYFEAVPHIWHSRTLEIAQNIVTGLYPSILIEQSTVDKTNAVLLRDDIDPALRRLLRECRDEVVRALAAQAVDAGSPALPTL